MSNHAARARHRKAPEISRVEKIAVAIFVLVAVTFPFYQHVWTRYPAEWPSVAAHVLETRIAIVGIRDHAYRPGEIDYQVEAHVLYELDGTRHDAWLPASDISADRIYLQYWLSQRTSKLCTVHWNPRNPSDIKVMLS
jgi:hypothetical protein